MTSLAARPVPLTATPRCADVVVVGGGTVGAATARALARRGASVVLLERFGPGTGPDDAAARALQASAATDGVLVRHHRRVTAVERRPDGVLVRSAAGAAVRAHAAVVATGAGASGAALARSGAVVSVAADPGTGAQVAADLAEQVADLLLGPASGHVGLAAAG
ncbi:hypothetical protein GCM10027451_44680 [Geodermatophilus aquaeductus]|uniref:Pyridine nucleotide-disulphide oxidoreductase n=1 Tax=Geodermatophilus aquaeductus TaxID=1564161 RepID=A0A521FPW1_9ACTN|nr:FAD-dependent oxidoreductase [Geodermatophilus aquaeductus]SMO98209.1 Pyridine nucleotide-disulphide oxidoreductase [Geodermatophilus aquaeductus]